MSLRRGVSAAAAGLGAACLFALAITPAQASPVPGRTIYDSTATGEGLVFTAAIRPSIVESAGQFGSHFVRTSFNSQGGGRTQSLAAPFFPGMFAIGALTANVGCGGLKGWVEARYPESVNPRCTSEQSDAIIQPARSTFGQGIGAPQVDDAFNDAFERVDPGVGRMHAVAGLGTGTTSVDTADLTVRPQAGDAPVLEIGSLTLDTFGTNHPLGPLRHEATVIAEDISLFDGGIKIRSLASRAATTSDGEASTAEASLTFGRITVRIDGTDREATIDHEGIRVTDPAFDQRTAMGLSEDVNEALLRAGISLSTSSPVEITDGATAEAAVGGLVIGFHATPPAVPVPAEVGAVVGPVLDQVKPVCLTDFGAPVPLCAGLGVVPLGGSELVGTMTIGRASSFSVAALSNPLVVDPLPSPQLFSWGRDAILLTPRPEVQPVAEPATQPPAVQQPQPFVQQGPLLGRVARMPDELLAFLGAALTLLAFGLTAWPSLRDAQAR